MTIKTMSPTTPPDVPEWSRTHRPRPPCARRAAPGSGSGYSYELRVCRMVSVVSRIKDKVRHSYVPIGMHQLSAPTDVRMRCLHGGYAQIHANLRNSLQAGP